MCQQALRQSPGRQSWAWGDSAGEELLEDSSAVALAALLVWLRSLVPVSMICHLDLSDALVSSFLKRDFSQFPILPFFRMPLNGMNS